MTHPSELQLSMLADGALSSEEATRLEAHVHTCVTCQGRVDELRDETARIMAALEADPAAEPDPVTIPRFAPPTSLRSFAIANLATGLVIWLAQFLWKTIFGELVMNATTWVTSIYLPDIYAMGSTTALYVLEEGTAMLDAYLGFIVTSLIVITVAWALLAYRRARGAVGACLCVVMTAAWLLPTPANALELKRDEDVVTIAEEETVDDTVLAAAETILVEGTIDGDLVAVGRRIEVSGSVRGNLIAFGETVTISGRIQGMVLGAASSYDLRGASVAGDLWVAGEKVAVDADSDIGRNAVLATETSSIAGHIDKDLYAFGETIELSGVLGEDLEAFASRVRLLGDADVGGNVRFRSGNEDRLHRSATARVGGEVEFLDMPEEFQDRSRYATVTFYLWQVARLIAALLAGLVFFWLFPGCRNLSLGTGMDTAKAAGIGFLTLVCVPVVAVLLGMTLIGLPMSLITFAIWLAAIYLAKIVLGNTIGRMVVGSDSPVRALFVGLTIVIVAINLPFIGGIVSFLLTITGLGLLLLYLIGSLPGRRNNEPALA